MSDVEFNGEQRASQLYNQLQTGATTPKIVGWVISSGIAKTEEGANKILLVIALIAIIATGYILYSTYGGKASAGPTPDQLKIMQTSMPGKPR